uniref:Uncharacterized protein n=1 Tax=Arundo donax TaxID=35708 RepID=A0A0A9CA40_ARUDO
MTGSCVQFGALARWDYRALLPVRIQ